MFTKGHWNTVLEETNQLADHKIEQILDPNGFEQNHRTLLLMTFCSQASHKQMLLVRICQIYLPCLNIFMCKMFRTNFDVRF
jgi:hypothetical protein